MILGSSALVSMLDVSQNSKHILTSVVGIRHIRTWRFVIFTGTPPQLSHILALGVRIRNKSHFCFNYMYDF